MIFKLLVSLIVAILLRPVFKNDIQYMEVSFLTGVFLAIVFALIEGKKIEKK